MTVLELDRWHDDGGPAPVEPLPPLVITLTPDTSAFLAAMNGIGQSMAAIGAAMNAAAEEVAANLRAMWEAWTGGCWIRLPVDRSRWRTDVPPTRWRDWLPSSERPVDRARRQHVDRQMRTLQRRAARGRRHAARIGRDR